MGSCAAGRGSLRGLQCPTPSALSLARPIELQALARFDVELSASAPGLGLALSWWERRNASGALSHGYWTSTYAAAGTGVPESFSTLDVFGGRYVQLTLLGNASSGGGGAAASLTVSVVSPTDVRYPLELVGAFDAPSDPFLGRLFSSEAGTAASGGGGGVGWVERRESSSSLSRPPQCSGRRDDRDEHCGLVHGLQASRRKVAEGGAAAV